MNTRTLVHASIGLALLAGAAQAVPVIGSSSGVFSNPVGPVGMVATGAGTDHFGWGVGSPANSLDFTGTSFNIETGTVFSFGTLDYYNGSINTGTEATAVDFVVSLALTTPVNSQAYDFTFSLINSPNVADPIASADFVQLNSGFSTTTFSYGGIDYTLEFLGFGTISGGGFSTIDQFHVLENGRATAELLGRITDQVPTPAAVPEPGTLALFGLGMAGLAAAARRRRA